MGAAHLSSEERFYIEKRQADDISMRAIAKEMGRCPVSGHFKTSLISLFFR